MAHYTKLTEQKLGKFLAELRRHGNATRAAKAIGCSREALYYRRADDSGFAAAWAAAMEEYAENVLEAEADRRAIEGVVHKTYYDKDGNEVGTERRFSDTLLIFRLKALKPEMYRDPPKGIDPAIINLFLQQVLVRVDDTVKEELLSWVEGHLGVSAPSAPGVKAIPISGD